MKTKTLSHIEEYLSHSSVFTLYYVVGKPLEVFGNDSEMVRRIKIRSSQLLSVPESEALEIYLETSRVVFEGLEFNGLVKFTEINPYGGMIENDISDIVVIGNTEKVVEERFAKELVLSEKRRTELELFLKQKILPFIKALRTSGWAIASGRRGDLMVPTRHPTPWSNINVSIVTEKETEKLIEKLEKSPGSIEVLNFGERGRGRYISEIIVDRGDPVVFYDVWPMTKLEEWLRGGEWKKYRYFSQMFQHFEFLWDDTGNIIELFRKTRKHAEKL